MKLRLIQKGYENFNGLLGVTEFKDGVSVNDVPPREATNIGMSIKTEWEDKTDPNPAQNLLNHMHTKAGEQAEAPAASATAGEHTQESLETIADEKGIKGLREIAEPLGIKGTSIKELISEILAYKPE